MNSASTAPTVLVVGSGNVAWHLCSAFEKAKLPVVGVANRTVEKLHEFKQHFSIPVFDLKTPPEADIIVLAVSDNSIHLVSEQFINSVSTVVHTSGVFGIKELHTKVKNKGVFYPFQSFTKGNTLDYSSIPLFVESDTAQSKKHLSYLASAFDSAPYCIDAASKKSLHISGVFANNFINKLLQESMHLLEENQIPQEVIWPLVEETIKKAKHIGPAKAQTGPAIRNDQKTINEHLEYLKNQPELQNVYAKLTQLIQEKKS